MLSSLKVPLDKCVKVVVTVFLGYMLSNLEDKNIRVYCIVSLCMLHAKFLWHEADMLGQVLGMLVAGVYFFFDMVNI